MTPRRAEAPRPWPQRRSARTPSTPSAAALRQAWRGSGAARLWPVVGIGFLALAVAFSARASLGLAMPVWERDPGWSRGFVSAAAAAALVVMAGVAPIAGMLVDRRGPRLALTLGLGALAVGCAGVAAAAEAWTFLLAYAGVAALGFAIVAAHVVATAVAQATEGRRGLATGLATSGATAGQFVVVPLVAALLAVASWRWSFAGLAAAAALLAALAWLLLPARAAGAAREDGAARGGFAADLRHLLARPVFHLLFWSFLLCGFTTTGTVETHLLPYAALCGFPPVPSAAAYGVLSLVNLLGMVLAGWLADRMHRPLLLAGIYLGRALAFLLLLNIGAGYEALLLFAVLFGAVDYATVPVTASLAASHLGLRVMGLAMGLVSAGHAAGGAAGALLGGWLFDLTGHYDWVWQGSLLAAAVAGGLALLIREGEARRGAAAQPA